MTRIIENIKAHYETHEVPFGRIYLGIKGTSPLSASAARYSPLAALVP